MSEFKKPTRVQISINKAFKELLNRNLVKDLHDNEEICPICGGTGLEIINNPYGLSDDPNKIAGVFPYKHMSITFCRNCYNGVVRICPDCGQQIPRGFLECSCEAARQKREEKKLEIYLEKLHNAEHHSPSVLGAEFKCAYSDDYDKNEGYFFNWEDFFDYWNNNHTSTDERPEYVWGTQEIHMRLNANDVIDKACEDLYEEAEYDISDNAREEMQTYFNKWLSKNGLTAYTYDDSHAIRIPWEENENE